MIRRPPQVGRNDKCPCKSGKKFKQCCLPKMQPQRPPPTREQMEAEQQARAAMQSARSSPLTAAIIQDRVREFRKRFGREPGHGDRIFFEAPTQDLVIEKITLAMKAAHIDPAHIYAFKKTGLIVVSENMDFLTGEDLNMWLAAIDEYRAANPHGERNEQLDMDSHK